MELTSGHNLTTVVERAAEEKESPMFRAREEVVEAATHPILVSTVVESIIRASVALRETAPPAGTAVRIT